MILSSYYCFSLVEHFCLCTMTLSVITFLSLIFWNILFFSVFQGNSLKKNNWRSSRPEEFCKKGVLRNFTKFTGKHLCQSLRPATLLKMRLWHRCFPVNFVKFLRTPFLTEHIWWLFLQLYQGHFFNTVAACSIVMLLKRDSGRNICFLVNFAELFRRTIVSSFNVILLITNSYDVI